MTSSNSAALYTSTYAKASKHSLRLPEIQHSQPQTRENITCSIFRSLLLQNNTSPEELEARPQRGKNTERTLSLHGYLPWSVTALLTNSGFFSHFPSAPNCLSEAEEWVTVFSRKKRLRQVISVWETSLNIVRRAQPGDQQAVPSTALLHLTPNSGTTFLFALSRSWTKGEERLFSK